MVINTIVLLVKKQTQIISVIVKTFMDTKQQTKNLLKNKTCDTCIRKDPFYSWRCGEEYEDRLTCENWLRDMRFKFVDGQVIKKRRGD
jgi:hypothetical protein